MTDERVTVAEAKAIIERRPCPPHMMPCAIVARAMAAFQKALADDPDLAKRILDQLPETRKALHYGDSH